MLCSYVLVKLLAKWAWSPCCLVGWRVAADQGTHLCVLTVSNELRGGTRTTWVTWGLRWYNVGETHPTNSEIRRFSIKSLSHPGLWLLWISIVGVNCGSSSPSLISILPHFHFWSSRVLLWCEVKLFAVCKIECWDCLQISKYSGSNQVHHL